MGAVGKDSYHKQQAVESEELSQEDSPCSFNLACTKQNSRDPWESPKETPGVHRRPIQELTVEESQVFIGTNGPR